MSDCFNIGNEEVEEEEEGGYLREQGECSTNPNLELHSFQDHRLLFPSPMHHQDAASDPFFPLPGGERAGGGGLFHPWAAPFPQQVTPFGPTHHGPDPFLFPPPAASSTGYGGIFGAGGRRPHHPFAYDGPSSSADPLRILSEAFGQHGGAAPFGLHMQAELSRMTAQEIMDAKALAASKSHSEAERRRRERINNHLAKLRSLLPSTTKTDKASLLAEVIHHVKELKRQTAAIAETTAIPTESDELTVDPTAELDSDGRLVVKASLCCDDRTDLIPDLIKALKALRLRTLRAEITTLGGRLKNVLFITGDDEQWSVSSIEEALRAVMEKSGGGRDDSGTGNAKRQRTNGNINILN